jgi:hypothetical protein
VTTNVAALSVTASGSTTSRTLGDRLIDVVNVKDFGAKGDGSTDDTAAIQAAINAAFGPLSSPHGQGNPFLNKPLYFPAGNYIISSPLYLKNILGGHIYGAGDGSTQIFFVGTGAEGNSFSSEYPQFTPVFMIDGVAYTVFEGISLGCSQSSAPSTLTLTTSASTISGTTLTFSSVPVTVKAGMQVYDKTSPNAISAYVLSTTPTTVTLSSAVVSTVGNGDTIIFVSSRMGFYVYQSGSNGSTSGITFRNMNISAFGTGIFAGGQTTANCENCSVEDCQFNLCIYAAIRLVGFNTLNWQVIGGGTSQCGTVSTFVSNSIQGNGSAAYSVETGGITAIVNMSCSNGTDGIDIYQAGSQITTVLGGRSESFTSIICNGAAIECIGWQWGPTLADGQNCNVLDLTFSGEANLSNCQFGPNFTGSGTRLLAALGNQGVLTLENHSFTSNASQLALSGASNSRFYVRGAYVNFGGSNPTDATLFGSYTGKVIEYEPVKLTTVGNLPAANAKFDGLRGFVIDSNVTASGNFGAAVAAGASNHVPVYCDGGTPAWRIG